MRALVFLLLHICRFSRAHPRSMVAAFLVISVAGFATTPLIKVSANLLAGVGLTNPVITLTKENSEIFGEQDSLTIVLEFAEPPGENVLPMLRKIGEDVAQLPGVRRVRYRFLDPENQDQVDRAFRNFFLGMNRSDRERVNRAFSPEGICDALRRTRDRLFLVNHPYVQKTLLEDPLEVGRIIADSVKRRLGALGHGDLHLFITSPDNTLYLIQVTPEFPSMDLARGTVLIEQIRRVITERISEAAKNNPDIRDTIRNLKWDLTGKTVFVYESDVIFDRETATIVLCSFGLVVALLLGLYRSFWSAVILMTPLAAGIGTNYGVIYLSYNEVNPVVMGATGVLLGLGAEYGEHLWGRIREEIDRGVPAEQALIKAYEQTGPPVMLGGLTGILAFLCLCLSNQPALVQFGYFGATGLALTIISTFFLVPAIFAEVVKRKKDHFPVIKVSFSLFGRVLQKGPKLVVAVSALVIVVSLFFIPNVSYEKDLLKVFLPRPMNSLAVSKKMSGKFHANFSQPVLLSFDVEDLQDGLVIQRKLDAILEGLLERDRQIASFDSISPLMSPDSEYQENLSALLKMTNNWPDLRRVFEQELKRSDLSASGAQAMEKSFDFMGRTFRDLETSRSLRQESETAQERSQFMAKYKGRYRFLTPIRFADRVSGPEALRQVDHNILENVKRLSVPVGLSGSRQTMEAVQSTLVSDLMRLGLYSFLGVVLVFFIMFPHPIEVGLCLVPMIGAFSITLGAVGALGLGVPFSIVCVAPLIFGFSIHNAIHIVMGSLQEEGGSVFRAVARVTPRAMVTSLTITMGFVSMLTSSYYALEFLGLTMIMGLVATVPLTLTALPALVLLLEKRRSRSAADPCA